MDLRQSSALLAAFVTLAVAVSILLRDRRRVYVRFAILALNLCAWHASCFFYRYLGDQPWSQIRFAVGVLIPPAILALFSALANVRGAMVGPLRRTITVAGLLMAG